MTLYKYSFLIFLFLKLFFSTIFLVFPLLEVGASGHGAQEVAVVNQHTVALVRGLEFRDTGLLAKAYYQWRTRFMTINVLLDGESPH